MADKTADDVVVKTPRQSELEATRDMIKILNARLAGSPTDEDRRFNLEKLAALQGREAELLDLVEEGEISGRSAEIKGPPEVSPIRTDIHFIQPARPVKSAAETKVNTEPRYIATEGPKKVPVTQTGGRILEQYDSGQKGRGVVAFLREKYRGLIYRTWVEKALGQVWRNLNPGAAAEVEEAPTEVVEVPVVKRAEAPQGRTGGSTPNQTLTETPPVEAPAETGVVVSENVVAKSAQSRLVDVSDNVLSGGKVFWKEYGSKIVDFVANLYSNALIFISRFGPNAVLGAGIGGLLGGLVGAIAGNSALPVVGGVVGAGGGFVVGNVVGGATVFAFQGRQISRGMVMNGVMRTMGIFIGDISTVFIGGNTVWIGALAAIIIVLFFVLFGMPGTTNIAFSLDVEGAHDTMGEPAIFTVEKTSDTISLTNTDTKTVTYTIKVTPEPGMEIEIGEIHDVATAYGNYPPETIHDKKLAVQNGVYLYTDRVLVTASDIPDSNLINTVSVTATAADGQTQIQTAQTLITVGNPPAGGPYGFPVGGGITSLDDEPFKNKKGVHCALMYLPSDTCTPGGVDIALSSGDVVSTADGHVFSAGFSCSVGGFVYVQSGPYRVAYIHLKEALAVKTNDPVKRGQVLGKVYDANDYANKCDDGTTETDEGLLYSTGPHIHYQVVRVTTNLFFSQKRQEDTGQTNVGACLVKDSTGDLIKSMYIEPAFVTKTGNVAQGPLNCTE